MENIVKHSSGLAPSRAGTCFCPACGGTAVEQQRFCPWCGHQMVLPVPPETVEPVPVAATPCPSTQAATVPPIYNNAPPSPAVKKTESVPAANSAASPAASCPHCGHTLSPPCRFCSDCGQPVAAPPAGELLIHSADGQDRRLSLKEGTLLIGRGTDCDLCLSGDGYLSRRHARLTIQKGQVILEDLGSAHGTWGRLQQATELDNGDEILMGTTVLTITAVPPAL